MAGSVQTAYLETFTEWRRASTEIREVALQACVDRIQSMDPLIDAWAQVRPQRATGSGTLSGIPFGAKDIMETEGLCTEYGSSLYKGRISSADASIVRELRDRGAILLGKTRTAAFAYRAPASTRNPRHLDHTPGGSSSGSAAAVAAGMVPFALGTQTLGSVLRPASYCGVTGFKTSYGLLSMRGVLPFAESLDTLGFFTHTPTDMLALWESLGRSVGGHEDVELGAVDPIPDVEPEMAVAFQNALSRLRRGGMSIRSIAIDEMLVSLDEAANTVMFYEGARFHRQRFEEHGEKLDDLSDLVRKGGLISAERYDEARRHIAACRARIAEMYKLTPVMLVPAATGMAPKGLTWTGDARMNAPWTALGTPAISLPMPVPDGLPLGLQLTAEHGQDARLIRTAVLVAAALGRS